MTEMSDIKEWLTGRVAYYVQQPPADIDPTVKLMRYGLDSIYALRLCDDIEQKFDLELDPSLAWDYPTIDAITNHLHKMLAEESR